MAAIILPTMMFAIQKKTPVFVCGISTSFNDSTVYFTEIQLMDSAYTDKKTGFLYSRDNYAYQLREHMKKNGVAHPTCAIIFDKKRKGIEKKYTSLKKRYATKGRYDVKYVSDFEFTPIIPDESEMKAAPRQKKEKKSKNK